MSKLAQAFEPAAPQGSGISANRVQKNLEDLVEAMKLKVTTEGVAHLMAAGSSPTKDQVAPATEIINTALKLDERKTEKERAAEERATAAEQRARELEANRFDQRREERRDNMDWMASMAQQNQTLMTMLLGTMAEQRSGQSELLTKYIEAVTSKSQTDDHDPIRQIGLQAIMGRLNQDPASAIKSAMETLKELGVPVGQQSTPFSMNGIPLSPEMFPIIQWLGDMGLRRDELTLKEKEALAKLENETTKSKGWADMVQSIGVALAQRPDLQVLRGGQAPGPQQAPGPRPARAMPVKHTCAECGRPHAFGAEVPGFPCEGCGVWNDVVPVGQAPEPEPEDLGGLPYDPDEDEAGV